MTPYSLFDHYFIDKVREVLKQYGPYKVLCLFKKETEWNRMLCIWNNVFNNSSYDHVVMWLRSLKGADPGAEKQMKVKMKKKVSKP